LLLKLRDARAQTEAETLKSGSSFPQQAALAKIQETLAIILAKVDTSPRRGDSTKRQRKPTKPETVMFAAILLELRGMKYCSYLHEHGIKPRWPESDSNTFPRAYQAGDPWRKKIQDQKTRLKLRMDDYSQPELAIALNAYLPDEFDRLSALLNSRNSPKASKTSIR
jgi:hypothetical protein